MTAKTIARRAEAAQRAADEAAFQARIGRLNAAIRQGAVATLHTSFGDYQIAGVRSDCWFICCPVGEKLSQFNQQSFCCHGGTVNDAMRQIGIE